jgi:hypothetical protein
MAKSLSTAERIGQYLAQAEATPHEEEKMTFFAAAQKLATRTGIDMAVARAAIAKTEEREKPEHRRLTLGKRGQRALSWYCELAQTIAGVNDLRMTMAHNSTYINFYGMPSDIDVTEAVYAVAVTAMVSGADAYLKDGEYKKEIQHLRVKTRGPNPAYDPDWNHYYPQTDEWGDKVPKYVYTWGYVDKPVSGMTARQNFYRGFVQTIGTRLREAKREARETAIKEVRELEAAAPVGETSTEIVLREKSKEVGEYYEVTTRGRVSRGSYKGSRSPVYSSTASSAGASHARGVDLGGRKSITTGPTRISS